jgi:GTP-binding protein
VVRGYLAGRPTLRRVFLLIDSRHGIKPVDREIFALFKAAAVTFEIVLTKCDKLNEHERAKIEAKTFEDIAKEVTAFPRLVATASETGYGIDRLRADIAEAIGFTG